MTDNCDWCREDPIHYRVEARDDEQHVELCVGCLTPNVELIDDGGVVWLEPYDGIFDIVPPDSDS